MLLYLLKSKVWPYSGAFLIQTPTVEWCVVGRGIKNGQRRDIMLKRDWIIHSKFVNQLDSMVNVAGQTYMTSSELENLHFDIKFDIHLSTR